MRKFSKPNLQFGDMDDAGARKAIIGIGVALVAILVAPWAWQHLGPRAVYDKATKEEIRVARVLPQPPPVGEGRYKPRYDTKPQWGGNRIAKVVPNPPVEAAKRYITARENEATHSSPDGWVGAVRPLMTPEAFAQKFGAVKTGPDAKGGAAWLLAQRRNIRVQVEVKCTHYPELGKPTAQFVALTCTAIDKPVYADGQPVQLADLDGSWVYIGVRTPPYRLAMTAKGGGWVVGADATGVA